MKRLFIFVTLLFSFSVFASGEIVVITSLKGISHVYSNYSTFFSEILLSIYGGNKYGAGLIISPSSSSNFQDVQINLEKVEFFTVPFDFLKVYYWYGVRKYLGYEATYQGYIYHPSKDFSFRGWRWIAGTGIDLDFSFFSDKLNANLYVYRSKFTNDGAASADLELIGIYRDIMISGVVGVSEANIRGGVVLKTLFRTMNAVAVLGIDNIPFTNLTINVGNVYALAEERVNASSSDNTWGVEQIFSIMLKPQIYNGITKKSDISDMDIRLTGTIRFLQKLLVGAEGIMGIYNLTGAITQLYITAWASPVIGMIDNNVCINIKPSLLVLSTQTNTTEPQYKVMITGEVRF